MRTLFLLLLLFSFKQVSLSGQVYHEKILICGVCKNVERALPNTIRNIERLGERFLDYQVIIYENNSTDRTVEILKKWAVKNRHVEIHSEHLSDEALKNIGARCFTWDKKPSRMELIARARNRVLEWARDPKYKSFKFLLMADLDFEGAWPVQEIVRTARSKRPWDCVSANGIDPQGVYYDNFALRDKEYPFGPELIGASWWSYDTPHVLKLKRNRGWYPVYSAFGGLAIYKREKILACNYAGFCTEDLAKEYKRIIRNTSWHNFYFRKYKESVGLVAKRAFFEAPIRFQINSGYYQFPVCCEHVTLHASMREKGFRRMYINPKMVIRYKSSTR